MGKKLVLFLIFFFRKYIPTTFELEFSCNTNRRYNYYYHVSYVYYLLKHFLYKQYIVNYQSYESESLL
jgi:hypothetical protein